MKSIVKSIYYLVCAKILYTLLGCGGAAPVGGEDAPIVSGFQGVRSIEKVSDVTWRIGWDQVPNSGVLYGVFMAKQEESIDFEKAPFATTRQNIFQWKRDNIFDGQNFCFAIRVINIVGDDNVNQKCTTDTPYVFTGIENMSRQSDGAWLLEWPEVKSDSVIFQIYSRDPETADGYDFGLASYFGIKENFYKIPVLERGEKRCFVSRYILDNAPEDANEKEICTPDEQTFDFVGVKEVRMISGTNDVRVSWDLLDKDFISGYKIYQGSDFTELVNVAAIDVNELVVEGLISGRKYSFGVRAFDEYNREDGNFKALSIVIP